MKLVKPALAAGLLLAATSSDASAITFSFSCTGDQSSNECTQSGSGGSTTSATLDFTQIAGNTIQVVVDNTSPIDFAPALLSFGFFIDPDDADLSTFTASAFDDSNTNVDITSFWNVEVDDQVDGLRADFIANNGNGVQDGLYNPGIVGTASQPAGSINPFFTTAVFTFVFDRDVSLLLQNNAIGSGLTGTTFVRFQKVGPGGNGSTKIACPTTNPSCYGGPTPVPEPGMLALVGTGLIGLALINRRRRLTD